MRHRHKKTTTALFVFVLLIETMITAAQNNTFPSSDKILIVVDQKGDKGYRNLEEALKNATFNSTIYIKEGIYDDVLEIEKPVTIIGAGINRTIIKPLSGKNKYAIHIKCPNVIIKNMTITNKGKGVYTTGIKITSIKNKVENVLIKNVPVGIALWSSNNKILNTTFQNNTDEGIAFLGTKQKPLTNNEIINCRFIKNCDGIELQYSTNNKIINCSFFNNTHDGISMITQKNNNNLIKNCTIQNNNVHGIYIQKNSWGNQIVNCFITKNKEENIAQIKTDKPWETTSQSLTIKTLIEKIRELFNLKTLNKENKSNHISLLKTIFQNIKKQT